MKGSASQAGVALRYRGRDISLPPGRYTIGRSATCSLVLDEPLVSRQHAEVNVGHDTVSVRDLGSVNGTLVNGALISGPTVVQPGDRIGIGRQEFEVRPGPVRNSNPPSGLRLTGNPARAASETVPPTSSPDSAPGSAEPTKAVDALELIGTVADKALAAGRVPEAEDILRLHLKRVLDGVKDSRPVSDDSVRAALAYSLKLASATGSGKWVDFAVELAQARRAPLTAPALELLRTALTVVPTFDTERLGAYAKLVRGLPATLEQLTLAQTLEDLARVAKSRQV
jgi:predicted component of type VI protein secretion system